MPTSRSHGATASWWRAVTTGCTRPCTSASSPSLAGCAFRSKPRGTPLAVLLSDTEGGLMAEQRKSGPGSRHVRDVMTPNPSSVSDNDTIREVARIMKEQDTGVVPVCDGG